MSQSCELTSRPSTENTRSWRTALRLNRHSSIRHIHIAGQPNRRPTVVRILILIFLLLGLEIPKPCLFAADSPPAPAVELDPEQIKRELEKETKAISLRGDDERLRPESQFQTMIGRTRLTFTGAATLDFNYQDNLNLETTNNRDRFRWTPRVELDFIAEFPQGFYLFTELGLENALTFRKQDKPMNVFQLQLNEFFFQAPLPFRVPSALRIGRQQFFEPRRWFISETLDAVRLLVDPYPFHFRLSVSAPVTNDDKHIRLFDDLDDRREQIDIIASTTYDLFSPKQKSKAGWYILFRDDDSPRDEDPIWVGLRTYGRPKFKFKLSENELLQKLLKPRIRYWLDTAFVAGQVKTTKIRGYAVDVGATYIARKLPYQPYLTLAYAHGSGDRNPSNGTDSNFRQTGFQDNSGKFGGVVNFDYYGILFDPELSNLRIYTAGLGFRPYPRTSVDLVYHHYEQNALSDTLRNADVSGDLTGTERNLGDEIDVIVGVRAIRNMRFRWRNGYFLPGPAFKNGEDDPAFETRLDVQFSF